MEFLAHRDGLQRAGAEMPVPRAITVGTDHAPLPPHTGTRSGSMIRTWEIVLLSAKDGKTIWSVNVLKAHDGENIKWKNASAPLIEGNLAIVYGGGKGQSFLAFERDSGKIGMEERGRNRNPCHSHRRNHSHGVRQVIFLLHVGIGWSQPQDRGRTLASKISPSRSRLRPPRWSRAISYIARPDTELARGSTGFPKNGSKMTAPKFEKSNEMFNHWSTPIHHNGHLYGMFSFKKYGQGPLQCIELESGEVKWSKDGYGPGSAILSGDKLITKLSDTGEVAVVEASPAKYKELGRKKVQGKCWSTPVLSNGMVLARSTQEAVCLNVKAR